MLSVVQHEVSDSPWSKGESSAPRLCGQGRGIGLVWAYVGATVLDRNPRSRRPLQGLIPAAMDGPFRCRTGAKPGLGYDLSGPRGTP